MNIKNIVDMFKDRLELKSVEMKEDNFIIKAYRVMNIIRIDIKEVNNYER